MIRCLFLALMLAMAAAALAVEPGEMLADPGLEARARSISAELRCLVCQNQSIDDSNAELAHDLRLLVRERLSAGDTDAEAVAHVVGRYGEFVLLRPPVDARTILLWGAAPLLFAAGVLTIVLALRRRRAIPTALGPDEQAGIDRLLNDDDRP
ncbi:MAG: cytochrome c-type biogenesis protein [Cucumibacter sp.]